jgi:hypothetical protein
MFQYLNLLLPLAGLAARVLLIDTMQDPAAADELVSSLLFFY